MTSGSTDKQTQKVAAILAGIGLLAIVLIVVLPIAAAFSAQREDIQESLRQLGYFNAEIASQPSVEARLAELDREGAAVPGVIPGESTALAQAQLQIQIKALVEASHGTVRSIQIVPATAQDGFEVIQVQCDFTIPANALKSLAYAIGDHKPYLFVDEASIASMMNDPEDSRGQQSTLEMRWTVHGYRWAKST